MASRTWRVDVDARIIVPMIALNIRVRERLRQWGVGPVVFMLIALAIVVYALSGPLSLFKLFILRPALVVDGELWRMVTYAFVESLGAPMVLISNCALLWFFGSDLEDELGTQRLAAMLAAATLAGAFLVVIAWALGIGLGFAFGLAPITEAVIVAWGMRHPGVLVFSRFGFIMLPLLGRHLVMLAVVRCIIAAVSFTSESAPAILGGIIVGAIAGPAARWRVPRR